MASRENTTLQGTIIALILLVLLLFVGVFLLNNERNKQMAAAASAAQQAQSAQDGLRQAQGEANSFKTWMGFSESDTLQTIEAAYKKDMEQYGATFDEADRAYSRLVANLAKENRDLAAAEANAKQEVKNLKQQLLATETEKDKQIEQFSQQLDKANKDAAAERANFNKQREEMNAERDKLSEQLAGIRQEVDQTKGEAADGSQEATGRSCGALPRYRDSAWQST